MIDLQKIFILKEFEEVRLGGISHVVREIYSDIKSVKGWGSGYFCVYTLKIPRRTFYGWLKSSPITISRFLKLIQLWKFICQKRDEDVSILLKSLVPKTKRFSIAKGKGVKLPIELTDSLAYLIGYTIGDGCLTGLTEAQKSHFGIRIASDTKSFLEKVIQPLFGRIFSIKGHIYKVGDSECYELQVHSRVLYLFFHKLFEIPQGKKKGKLTIPKIILDSPSKIKMAFISGFFDADGCIYEKEKLISFSQADKQFLISLSKLLTEEGFLTRTIGTKYKELGITYDFSLRWSSLPKFLGSVHFSHPDRIRRANNLKTMLEKVHYESS